ncbi:MAG TPA: DUF1572 family protein [Gemmatimonadaceae bacterium]|nr:DUF1572 family protein [Gemmatimonadaceae bacterium]
MSREFVAAVEAEYRRYKAYAEGAFVQLTGDQMNARPNPTSNSIAMIVWHVSGNFASRFTEFLTTDGEKSWRRREEEFAARAVSKPDCLAKWDAGWKVVLDTLATLTDADLATTVYIRRQPLTVRDALLRSLAHASYHVGQIVYVAKSLRAGAWDYLSIAPGQSDAYNRDPKFEKPAEYVQRVSGAMRAPGS